MAALDPRLQLLADQYQHIRAELLAQTITEQAALSAISALSTTDDTGVVWGLDENGAWWTKNVHGEVAHNVNPATFEGPIESAEGQHRAERGPAGGPASDDPAPPTYAPPVMPYDDSKQTLALILGLCVFVAGIFTGIPAIIIGMRARKEATTHNVSSGKALAGIILGWFSVAGTIVTVVLFVLLFGFLASTTGGVVTNVPDGGPIDVPTAGPTTGPTTGTPSVKLPPPWVELPVNNTNMTATINDKPATIMAATVPVTTPEACKTLVATLASVAKRYKVKPDPDTVFFEGFRLALTDPATLQKQCVWSTTDTDPSSNPLSIFEDSATTGDGKTVVVQTGKIEDLYANNTFTISPGGSSSSGYDQISPALPVPPSSLVVVVFETS